MSNLWFQIAMADTLSMQYYKAFQKLPRNLLSLCSCCSGVVFHVLAEITIRDVLHRKKDLGFIFVPAVEFDE